MIRVHLIEKGGVQTSEGPGAIVLPQGAPYPWIEVDSPTPEESAALIQKLSLHELALEDAMNEGHPPKLEDFGDYLFLIIHTPDPEDAGDTRKVAIFFSKDWIVTFLRVPLRAVETILAKVKRDRTRFLKGPAFLMHAVVDQMSEGFVKLVDGLQDRVEELEERTYEEVKQALMGEILERRHEVHHLDTVVRSQRDVLHNLYRAVHPALPPKVQPYLRDLYDESVRIKERLESSRDTLAAARDAFLAASNARLGDVMRLLTVIATVMMPLGVVAGIYGMNFEQMPGLDSPAGFWITVGLMATVATAMLVWFRRRGWL